RARARSPCRQPALARRALSRMQGSTASAIAANRFGFGARAGELAAIGGDGREWLRAQLLARPPLLAAPQLPPSAGILAAALELRREIQGARKAGALSDTSDGAAVEEAQQARQVQQRLPQFLKPIYTAEVTARFAQAVATERPFVERLTLF